MDVGKHPVGLITAMEAEHLGCCIEQAIPGAIKQVGRDADQPDRTGSFGWNLGKKYSFMHFGRRDKQIRRPYKDVGGL